MIEWGGGWGINYAMGPAVFKISAFDFSLDPSTAPHLKGYADLNLTNNLFVTGGADDFAAKNRKTDWFFGAGVQMTDDDLKSLVGLFSAKP